MKKLLLTICVAAVTAGAFAQSINYGIRAGMNWSTQTFSAPGSVTYTNLTGFHAGVVADLGIHQFSIQPGLYFITKGFGSYYSYPLPENSSSSNSSTTIKRNIRLNYLELPVNLLYHVKLSPTMNLYFGGGPYIAYGISGKAINYPNAYSPTKSEGDVTFGTGFLDSYRAPDYGVNFLIGQHIKHFTIDINYSLGLADISLDGPYNKVHNRSFGASVGYWIK